MWDHTRYCCQSWTTQCGNIHSLSANLSNSFWENLSITLRGTCIAGWELLITVTRLLKYTYCFELTSCFLLFSDVELLLRRLEPLFAVDQLLQRTLMAAMSASNIEVLITSQKIPPEVCMANLTYFLKTNEFPLNEVQLSISVSWLTPFLGATYTGGQTFCNNSLSMILGSIITDVILVTRRSHMTVECIHTSQGIASCYSYCTPRRSSSQTEEVNGVEI